MLSALIVAVMACASFGIARTASPQEHAPPPPHETPTQQANPEAHAPEAKHAAAQHEAAGHDAGIFPVIAKLINFGILVGVLVYFLRDPITAYLRRRDAQIRGDLSTARDMRATAEAQLAEIDRRMRALPAELDALRERGRQEAEAEEERIRQLAASERQRLIDQTRREIELQERAARRALMRHAADLAVAVAAARIRKQITSEDHVRLLDQYAAKVQQGATR